MRMISCFVFSFTWCMNYLRNISKSKRFLLSAQPHANKYFTSDQVVVASGMDGKRYERSPQQLKKKRTVSQIPASIQLQILGTGANGSPSSVYLFTDHNRYLFNCGEGAQRLAYEHKLKISRLENIFLTRNTWQMMGGIPGALLTLQDAGISNLMVHGPPHMETMLSSMRKFVVLKTLKVTSVDSTCSKYYDNPVATVRSFPLYSDNPDTEEAKVAISYICHFKPKPGALNLDKCVELNIPPGPHCAQLKNGLTITLEDGREIQPSDVVDEGEQPLSFLVIDLPGTDFLSSLPEFSKELQAAKDLEKSDVLVVIHFSEQPVLEHKLYQEFMQSHFPAPTHHVYLKSPQNKFSGHTAAHRIQYQLNKLNPAVFPLLDEAKAQAQLADQKESASGITSLWTYHLRPRSKAVDRTNEACLVPEEYLEEAEAVPNFLELLEKLRKEYPCNLQRTPAYPCITFLGTGSAVPVKVRNVSAILVQTTPTAYMLMDCGEGTYGQIKRLFGPQKTTEILRQLCIIYISHQHADHHIGLNTFLVERRRLRLETKLKLLAPLQMTEWLDFYDEQIESINCSYELIPNASLLDIENPYRPPDGLGITRISTCFVPHCQHSYGLSVELTENDCNGKPIKLLYSGDTMPSSDLVELGKNATVVIHEATMEDELIEDAELKSHSTISQAIYQGQQMQADYIILTHFSQRYSKIPRLPGCSSGSKMTDNVREGLKNIAIAFDNMQVTIADLQNYHLMYPALYGLFTSTMEELELRSKKRFEKETRKRKLSDIRESTENESIISNIF